MMAYGTASNNLRVDLSIASNEVEEISKDFYRLFPGCKALADVQLVVLNGEHAGPDSGIVTDQGK